METKNILGENGEVYSELDAAWWKREMTNYAHFWSKVQSPGKYSEHDKGALQALFLGEKPASFGNPLALDNKDSLLQAGFRFTGEFVYKAELVDKIMKQYPAIFKDYQTKGADMLMQDLSAKDRTEKHLERGLVLGFPLESAKGFEKEEREIQPLRHRFFEYLRQKGNKADENLLTKALIKGNEANLNTLLKRHPNVLKEGEIALLRWSVQSQQVNIHGVVWNDYGGSSPESERLQQRMNAAFETSGILKVEGLWGIRTISHSVRTGIRKVLTRKTGQLKQAA